MKIIFKEEESGKIKEMFNLDWDDFYSGDLVYGLLNNGGSNGRLLIGEQCDNQHKYKPLPALDYTGEFTFNTEDYTLNYKTEYGEYIFKHKSTVNMVTESEIAKLEAQIAELRKQLV